MPKFDFTESQAELLLSIVMDHLESPNLDDSTLFELGQVMGILMEVGNES